MAININRTPLAAVGALAQRGGEATAARAARQFEREQDLQSASLSASLFQQQEGLAARASENRLQVRAQRESQEAGFRQQLAQQNNQDRLNRDAEERAFSLQNAAAERNLLGTQQRQTEALALLETLKDKLDPRVFVESVLAIKQDKVPAIFRQSRATGPQRSPSETIDLVGRIKALNLDTDSERALFDQAGLPTPVTGNKRILTSAGRNSAEIDIATKIPDPFFGGVGPGVAYTQKDLAPIYKNFLEDNRYLILGAEGRRELEDIWERGIRVVNQGSFFQTTGGGRLNIGGQYEWNRDDPTAVAARASFGEQTQRITEPTEQNLTDTQIQTAIGQAKQELGLEATEEQINARTVEILEQ